MTAGSPLLRQYFLLTIILTIESGHSGFTQSFWASVKTSRRFAS